MLRVGDGTVDLTGILAGRSWMPFATKGASPRWRRAQALLLPILGVISLISIKRVADPIQGVTAGTAVR